MPLYEYECEACGHRFEQIRKFADPPLEACPECEGPVRKLISSPAFQFKGTGWYVTDYAKSGSDKDGESGDAEGKPEAKADKPEKTDKTETKKDDTVKEPAAKPTDSTKATKDTKPAAPK